MGSGCIDPHFLDLGTSWRWVLNFTPRPLVAPPPPAPAPPSPRAGGGRKNACSNEIGIGKHGSKTVDGRRRSITYGNWKVDLSSGWNWLTMKSVDVFFFCECDSELSCFIKREEHIRHQSDYRPLRKNNVSWRQRQHVQINWYRLQNLERASRQSIVVTENL
jgi:hypothetical protein